jgi:signal transduction histidine kinase
VYHERVFGLFRTVGLPDRGSFDTSTGMGLALVARAMESMSGTVTVESDGDRGTSFVLSWPRRQADSGPTYQQYTGDRNTSIRDVRD